MSHQCFCFSPFHIPELKDLVCEHLSFKHITPLLKCNFLFHGANVTNCWDKLAKVSQQNLLNWKGSVEFADAAIIKVRSEEGMF